MTKQITEQKFSEWCKNNNYYRLKLQVNISNILIQHATATPADFLVLDTNYTYFVEVKEVLRGNSFPNSRFKQQFKLTKLQQQFENSHIKCFILINFIEYNKLAFLRIIDYNTLLIKVNQKSLKLTDIPSRFIFNWKTLTF